MNGTTERVPEDVSHGDCGCEPASIVKQAPLKLGHGSGRHGAKFEFGDGESGDGRVPLCAP